MKISLVRNYNPPVPFRHFSRFANGVTLRLRQLGLHIWFAIALACILASCANPGAAVSEVDTYAKGSYEQAGGNVSGEVGTKIFLRDKSTGAVVPATVIAPATATTPAQVAIPATPSAPAVVVQVPLPVPGK